MNVNTEVMTIEQKLESFKEMGCDRIHISGGTSKDGSHYSGVLGYRYDNLSKKISYVGLPYDSEFHLSGDSNGHTKKPNENPVDTAIREFFEETGLKANPEDLIPLLDYSVKDNRPGKEGGKHHKYFYMINIEKCSGKLATFEGRNPIDGETAAPIMIPVELFIKVVFKGYMQALEKSIEKLLIQNSEYAFALMNLR